MSLWGGGGCMAGNTQSPGDWVREEQGRVQRKQKQLSQPTKGMTNTRPRGLGIWYMASFPFQSFQTLLRHLSKIKLKLPSIKKNNTTHKYLLSLDSLNSRKNFFIKSLQARRLQKKLDDVSRKAPNKGLPEWLQTRPTTSERVKPQHMTPYNLNINKIKEYELDDINTNSAPSSLGRYVFGSEISYNKAPPRLPGLGC